MEIPSEWLWIVIVSFIVSFVLAFGIGANDVANSFGTSVGAKVLTLVQACILGTIFEIAGAVLIGYKVSDTIRKGIIDVRPYNGTEDLLLLGNLSALSGSCLWLMIATFLRLPVSATHSIVGATVGFSLVAKGADGVGWVKLGMIVASWFISPLASGIITTLLFMFVRKLILDKENQLKRGLILLPFFYGITICINAFSIFHDGSTLLHFNKIPLYGVFVLSIGLGVLTAVVVRLFVVPWQRKKIKNEVLAIKQEEGEGEGGEKKSLASGLDIEIVVPDPVEKLQEGEASTKGHKLPAVDVINGNATNGSAGYAKATDTAKVFTDPEGRETLLGEKELDEKDDKKVEMDMQKGRDEIEDKPETKQLFSFLQILTAIFGSFAHGGNDVSNAIAPLVAVWMIAHEQSVAQKAPTPIWVLFYGGVGISVGLCVWGRRVIKTMGEDLSKITPSSGFCIEIGAAITVLVASKLGIPISTTHCKVGSIVTVGRVRSRSNVDWSLFRNIFIAWIVTLPASGAFSAVLMAIFKYAL
ncbi:sodium-dependent phosphate transporter 1-A-like isoform X2 [Littorina saxatilis]|uniref:Phosphate transporter n=1 Tax=Littorina saxatilis TaxID=31220 RepID=A0AAN9G1C9_9CAEN